MPPERRKKKRGKVTPYGSALKGERGTENKREMALAKRLRGLLLAVSFFFFFLPKCACAPYAYTLEIGKRDDREGCRLRGSRLCDVYRQFDWGACNEHERKKNDGGRGGGGVAPSLPDPRPCQA